MLSLDKIVSNGKNIAYLAATVGIVYGLYKTSVVFRATLEKAGIILPDLGPKVELTPEARDTEAEYIRLGYLVRLPDGRTQITPLGEVFVTDRGAAE